MEHSGGGSPSAGPSPPHAAAGYGAGGHHGHQYPHLHHHHFHPAAQAAPGYHQHDVRDERRVTASPAPTPQQPMAHERDGHHHHHHHQHHHHREQGGHASYGGQHHHHSHDSAVRAVPYDHQRISQGQPSPAVHLQHHEHHAHRGRQEPYRPPHSYPAPPELRSGSVASTSGYPHHHHQHQHQQQQSHQTSSHGASMRADSAAPRGYDGPTQMHHHHHHHHQHQGQHTQQTLERHPQQHHQQQQFQQQQPQHQYPQREPSQQRASSVQSLASVAHIGHSRAPSLAPSVAPAAGVSPSFAALEGTGGHRLYQHQHHQLHHQHSHHQPAQHGVGPAAAAPRVGAPPAARQQSRTPAGAPPAPLMTVSIGTRAQDRSTNREGLTTASKGFVLHPPVLFGASWLKTPANPANGLGGIPVEDLSKEDFKFYCDPCQKGFNSKRLYDAHMEDHIYCEFPGCKFTCRKGKEWKMELHVTALHNRPDAPNLEDNEAYVRNRKSRFPTVETVQTKVEELYYKASRGEVLPDERRRWLKQHGVFVSRKWYLPVMREGDAALEESRRRRNEKRARPAQQEGGSEDQTQAAAAAAGGSGGGDEAQRRPPQPGAEGGDDLSRYARKPGERMLPLGPNGRYTKSQLVQMARERYENAQRAPAYYVCNRCGEKGHWVEACPKAKDATFDFEARWAGPKPTGKPAAAAAAAAADAPAAAEHVGADAGVADDSNTSDNAADSAAPEVSEASAAAAATSDAAEEKAGAEEDDEVMAEVSAKAQDVDPALREQAEAIRRTNGPALEARLASAQQRSARRAATAALEEGAPESEALAAAIRRARMRRMPTGPPKATLWDRLTEDQRMNEHSVLLQAIRFFRLRNYFDAGASTSANGGAEGDAPPPTGGDSAADAGAAGPDDNLEEV